MTQSQNIQYASFSQRVLATIIDNLVVMVLTLPLLQFVYGDALTQPRETLFLGHFEVFVKLIIPYGISVICWLQWAGTPGKRLLKLSILDARTGRKITLSQALLRYLAYAISALPFGMGIFWMIHDPKRQTWHDKIAHTVVVIDGSQFGQDSADKSIFEA